MRCAKTLWPLLFALLVSFWPARSWSASSTPDSWYYLADDWPARFENCRPYRNAAESAVAAYWGPFQFPEAWVAQLYQESLCDPSARSPVGAAGLAQFMPATWAEVSVNLDLPPGSTPHDEIAIEAGAYYQARQMRIWTARRPLFERWKLGLASYNAGAGNILRAQSTCARHGEPSHVWNEIAVCLPGVTGRHANETLTYVARTQRWWREITGCAPGRVPGGLSDEWGC